MVKYYIALLLLSFMMVMAQEQAAVPEKTKIAIVGFKEIGEIKRGAGECLAGIMASSIQSEHYQILERSRIREMVAEKLLTSPSVLKEEEMKEIAKVAQSDAIFVGEITDLYNSFSLSYRLVFADQKVSEVKDAIVDCPHWGKLQEKFRQSLKEKGLLAKEEKQIPEPGLGWHGEKLPSGMYCAQEKGIYVWGKDGSEMVYVPEGEFYEGNPPQKKTLPAYYIDRYEVTFAQYLNFCQTQKYPHLEKTSWNTRLDHPSVYVSWKDAKAYCEWIGKSLPTASQWEKAARGSDTREYPWPARQEPYPACYSRKEKEGTMPIGSYPEGISQYGCMDMAGNAAEWCEDWANEVLKLEKVLRGGSWLSPAKAIKVTVQRKQNYAIGLNFTGFRTVVNVFCKQE